MNKHINKECTLLQLQSILTVLIIMCMLSLIIRRFHKFIQLLHGFNVMNETSPKLVVKADLHVAMNLYVDEIYVWVIAVVFLCLGQQLTLSGCERWGDSYGFCFNILSLEIHIVTRCVTLETYDNILSLSLVRFQYWSNSMGLVEVVTEVFWHAKFLCHDFPDVLLQIFNCSIAAWYFN